MYAAGTVVFSATLLPSLLTARKPHPLTSLSTSLVLMAFALGYGSLGFWAASSMCVVEAGLWAALFVQTRR